jgi:hypothetical protein
MTRQARHQNKRRRAKLCVVCGAKPIPRRDGTPALRCLKCTIKRLEYQRQRVGSKARHYGCVCYEMLAMRQQILDTNER